LQAVANTSKPSARQKGFTGNNDSANKVTSIYTVIPIEGTSRRKRYIESAKKEN
jgi:hypothetical protein